MIPLYEKYRPSALSDVLGQPKAVALVQSFIDRAAVGGRAFWITGQSGGGKTTLARILAQSIADPFNVEEIDAAQLNADYIASLPRTMGFYGMGDKPGRAWIVNEAHGLRGEIIRRLLVLLESMQAHCVMIFTTTNDGHEKLFDDCDDGGPLLSRCVRIELAQRGVCEPFARRLVEIADMEGLNGCNGTSMQVATRILKESRNNMRAALQTVEAGAMLCASKGE